MDAVRKPKDPDSWKGRNGVISFIRQKMGADAPKMESCRLTLQRLAEDETDDVSREMVAGSGKERLLSDEEDLYIGLLLVEGHSQRSATFILNGERSAQALPPVSLGRALGGVVHREVRLGRRLVRGCDGEGELWRPCSYLRDRADGAHDQGGQSAVRRHALATRTRG